MLRLALRSGVCLLLLVLGVLLQPLVPAAARAEAARLWAAAKQRIVGLWTHVHGSSDPVPDSGARAAQGLVQQLDRMTQAQRDIVDAVRRLTLRLDQNAPAPRDAAPEEKR